MSRISHNPTIGLRSVAIAWTLVFLVAALFVATPAWAQDDEKKNTVDPTKEYNLEPNFDPNARPKRTPRNQKVTLDFRQASLDEVVKMFSSVMNKNFIISDSINTSKTITIISPRAVSVNEAYRAFLMALQMNGLTIVPAGSFLKIVESKSAIQEPMEPIDPEDRVPNEARMVTAIIPVENSDVAEIQEVLSKFVTPEASIIPYGSSLIVTENAANIRRLQGLVTRLDQGESANRVYVYKVLYAEATEVADKLQEIFAAQDGSANTNNRARNRRNTKANTTTEGSENDLNVTVSEIIPDERTNQLIIVSDKKSFEKIRDMIQLLDVPTAVGGQIHVKFLEYANAEELSQTLSSLAQGVNSAQNRNSNNAATRGRRTAAANAAPTTADLLSGEVQITAHVPTNALVIVASPRDYMSLENVIDLLDRPRKQVYVEAVIMEVGLDTNRQIALGFNTGLGQDMDAVIPDSAVEDGLVDDTTGLILGQSNYQGVDAALGGTGGALGLIGPLVQIPGTSISLPAFALLLQATQTDNSVNILSTPAILTMDNEEAEIIVGERVPFLAGIGPGGGGGLGGAANLLGAAGAANGAGALGGLGGLGALGGLGGLGGFGFVQPIQYEDVGITLRILPQVNESDYVRLEVDQEVSDIKGAGGLGGGAPITTRRNAKTVVLVKDQSTIVIGGLIRDVENDTVEKIPFLGDIPLIGLLFRNTSTITSKQNLVLMLTPYIIESEADLQKIRERKMEERRELLEIFGRRDLRYMKSVNFEKKTGLLDKMRQHIDASLEEQRAREEALEAFELDGPQYRILGRDELPDAAGDAADDAPAADATTDDATN
jgi:general secretion pathway protein D